VGSTLSANKQAVKYLVAVLQHICYRKSAKNFYRSHKNGRKTSGQLMLHRSNLWPGYPARTVKQANDKPLLVEACGQDMLHEPFQFMGKITSGQQVINCHFFYIMARL